MNHCFVDSSMLNTTLESNRSKILGHSSIDNLQNDYLQQFFVDQMKGSISRSNINLKLNQKLKQNIKCQNIIKTIVNKDQHHQNQTNIQKKSQIIVQKSFPQPDHLKSSSQSRKSEQLLLQNINTFKNKKVTNVPKFLLKCILTNFQPVFKKYLTSKQDFRSLKTYLNRIKRKQKIPSMLTLSKFARFSFKNSKLNQFDIRKIMMEIIGLSRKTEILENKKVKDKKLYLTASKVYMLRCRSIKLINHSTFR